MTKGSGNYAVTSAVTTIGPSLGRPSAIVMGRLETGAMFQTIAKLLIAGIGLAAICWLASTFFFSAQVHLSGWKNFLALMITIAVGAGAFFGAAYLLRVAEVHDVVELFRRKFSGRGD